ncbi:hypothetical protein DF3PA_290025 [Candidatus Defluviicoccus seviourii]|uniref:Uncharacterized protein n=1 Tax=Candidatus Defluviicoccus seviourii TaxID=2565273 RepID=A0A564WEQ8_9PROT|nr:hypothetical protein DF3PA_290025 [Candidatus Defluviicoccus seviourii]
MRGAGIRSGMVGKLVANIAEDGVELAGNILGAADQSQRDKSEKQAVLNRSCAAFVFDESLKGFDHSRFLRRLFGPPCEPLELYVYCKPGSK